MTTLECLVTGVPVLCLVALALQGGGRLGAAMTQSTRGMSAMRGEIALLTAAMALGQVLVLTLNATGAEQQLAALAPPVWAIISSRVAS